MKRTGLIAVSAVAILGSAALAQPLQQGINRYLDSLPDVVTLPASRTVVNQGAPQTNGFGDDRYTCEIDGVREQGSILQMAAFGSRSDVMWPGSLIQGSSLISNQLAPVALSHGPETIAITAFVPGTQETENSTRTVSAVLRSPSLNSVADAVNSLVFSNPGGHQPAAVAFTSSDFYNAQSGAVAISANFSSMGTDVSTYLRSEDYSKHSHVVVQFVQQYYTVAASPPARPADFFGPRVRLSEVQSQTSQEKGPNPVVYINTVTYGRVAYIFISSSERIEKLKEAVDASFSGLTSNGKFSGSTEQQRMVRSADVQVFVLGGDAALGANLVTQRLDGLPDWIKLGGTFSRESPGAAIAFSTRYLRSDYRIAGANFITDYSKPSCVQTPEKIVGISRSYSIEDDKDKGNAHRFLVSLGSQLIAEEQWTGNDIVWRSSPPNYNGPTLAVAVRLSDCSSLRFRTEQSGGNGKTTGRTWVYAVSDAGRKFTLVDGERFELENNSGKDYTTKCNVPS
jgi:hypothetical protein